jgi:hypothetical protein
MQLLMHLFVVVVFLGWPLLKPADYLLISPRVCVPPSCGLHTRARTPWQDQCFITLHFQLSCSVNWPLFVGFGWRRKCVGWSSQALAHVHPTHPPANCVLYALKPSPCLSSRYLHVVHELLPPPPRGCCPYACWCHVMFILNTVPPPPFSHTSQFFPPFCSIF